MTRHLSNTQYQRVSFFFVWFALNAMGIPELTDGRCTEADGWSVAEQKFIAASIDTGNSNIQVGFFFVCTD